MKKLIQLEIQKKETYAISMMKKNPKLSFIHRSNERKINFIKGACTRRLDKKWTHQGLMINFPNHKNNNYPIWFYN